ncbi:Nucleoid occlusion factor SlmA [compost metagenome]
MSTTGRQSKRELILKAAAVLVKEEGVERLTLEAVAKKAGISKGGLLYHFPNKEKLIISMVEQLSEQFVRDLNERVEKDELDRGRWSRAYAGASFEDCESELTAALYAALFTNPEMLAKMRDEYSVIQQKMENDGLDPVLATIVRLAADGLWYAEIFGLAPPGEELRKRVLEELKRWTKEGK